MKARITHLYELVAGFILSLLGFTGCDKWIQIFNPRSEYGAPHATYKLEGKVTDAVTGKGIEGLQITYSRRLPDYSSGENGEPHYVEEQVLTGKDGTVDLTLQDYRTEEPEELRLVIEDIDGEKNGRYATNELSGKDLEISYVKDNKSSWHMGTYTIAFSAKMMDYSNMIAEYGMPHATYKIVGSVTDTEGHPIPGIEVLASLWGQGREEGEPLYPGQTDQDGHFSLTEFAMPGATEVRVECKDVDGEANGGLFESKTGKADLIQEAGGDGKWDEGTFGASVDIQLKKQE